MQALPISQEYLIEQYARKSGSARNAILSFLSSHHDQRLALAYASNILFIFVLGEAK